MRFSFAIALIAVTNVGLAEHTPTASPTPARPAASATKKSACYAVEKSMGRIQSSVAHLKSIEKDCFTCHHNTMTMETFALARKHGVIGDEALASFKSANLDVLKKDLPAERIRDNVRFAKIDKLREAAVEKGTLPKDLFDLVARSTDPDIKGLDRAAFDRLDDIHGAASTVSSALTALRAGGEPIDERARHMVRYLGETQSSDGHWEPSEKRRVPSEGSTFQLTVNSVNALAHYGELTTDKSNKAAFDAGVKWLLAPPQAPTDTQDHAAYLSGLADLRSSGKLGAAEKTKVDTIIAREKEALLKAQEADGGWRQIAGRKPDAYATGLTLGALAKAGVSPDTAAYRKGVSFLLDAQDRNGDWLVPSRVDAQFETLYLIDKPAPGGVTAEEVALARPIQKAHRDLDDEHRGGLNQMRDDPKRNAAVDAHHRVHSQFISFMATNLATQALLPACEAEKKK